MDGVPSNCSKAVYLKSKKYNNLQIYVVNISIFEFWSVKVELLHCEVYEKHFQEIMGYLIVLVPENEKLHLSEGSSLILFL